MGAVETEKSGCPFIATRMSCLWSQVIRRVSFGRCINETDVVREILVCEMRNIIKIFCCVGVADGVPAVDKMTTADEFKVIMS